MCSSGCRIGENALVSEGDLNPEPGEISLNLGLNSKTGEKSPDRGVHGYLGRGAHQIRLIYVSTDNEGAEVAVYACRNG